MNQDLVYINSAKRVAHDLKSPLAVILTILKKGAVNKDDLELITKSTQSLQDISRDLFGTNENQYSNRTRYDLCHELRNISKLKGKEFGIDKKFVTFHFEAKSYLWINPSRMNRVFSNLFNNAFELMNIDLKLHIHVIPSLNGVQLIIKDNGPGFSKEQIQKFTHNINLISTKNGDGIGLSSAKAFLESENCTMKIRNHVSGGAEILIKFPADRLHTSQSTIILIDDDKYVRQAWVKAALSLGIKIATFSSYAKFKEEQQYFSRDAEIYLDSYLNSGERGENFVNEIYQFGFRRINIQSGRHFSELTFNKKINSVVPKVFPY